MRVGILLTCGKHLLDRIISLRGEVWVHNTILTPPPPVPSQDSDQLCICVLWVSILPQATILIFDFEIVPTVVEYFVFH